MSKHPRCRPSLGQCGPNLTNVDQTWPNWENNLPMRAYAAKLGQSLTKVHHTCSMLAELGSSCARIGQS